MLTFLGKEVGGEILLETSDKVIVETVGALTLSLSTTLSLTEVVKAGVGKNLTTTSGDTLSLATTISAKGVATTKGDTLSLTPGMNATGPSVGTLSSTIFLSDTLSKAISRTLTGIVILTTVAGPTRVASVSDTTLLGDGEEGYMKTETGGYFLQEDGSKLMVGSGYHQPTFSTTLATLSETVTLTDSLTMGVSLLMDEATVLQDISNRRDITFGVVITLTDHLLVEKVYPDSWVEELPNPTTWE